MAWFWLLLVLVLLCYWWDFEGIWIWLELVWKISELELSLVLDGIRLWKLKLEPIPPGVDGILFWELGLEWGGWTNGDCCCDKGTLNKGILISFLLSITKNKSLCSLLSKRTSNSVILAFGCFFNTAEKYLVMISE